MFQKVCMTWLSGLCCLSLLWTGCGVPSLVEGLGQVKWEGKLTQEAEFPPLLANGMLFVAGRSSLSAWDARTGKLAWSHDTREHTWSGQPVVSQGTLLLGTQQGKVIGLDPNSGETLWSFQMENSRIFRAPVLHGNIACFMGWKQEERTLSFYALDIQKQALAWQHNTTYSPSVQDGSLSLGRPAISGNTVFFNVWGLAFFAFDVATGEKSWVFKLPKEKNSISSNVETSPLVAGDLVLLGSTNGLYALNSKTGQQRWHAGVAPTGHMTHEDQIVYVPGQGSGVTALHLNNGKIHWQASTTNRGSLPPPDTHTPPLLIGSHIYVAHLEGEIDIVDKKTGQPLGKYRAAERPSWVGLATDGATLFVVQDKSILAQAIHSPAQQQ